MLKKFIITGFWIIILGALMTICYAETQLSRSYTIVNNSAAENTTYVSNTTIVPGLSRILGFTVMPTLVSRFSMVAFYDESNTTTHSLNNLIGEGEALQNETRDKIFPYPKSIATQLKVILGAYSAVTIDYTK